MPLPFSSPNEALLAFYEAEEAYVAGGSGDFDVIARTLHPAIVLYQPDSLPYGGVWRGHAGFEAWLEAFAATWSSARPSNPETLGTGIDTLVTAVTMEATSRDTGLSVSMPMCQIVRIEDGLPIEWRNFCWDTAAVLRAITAGDTSP